MTQNCPTCATQPHEQDKIHGKGNRVFNEHENDKNRVRRCTRCGHEQQLPKK